MELDREQVQKLADQLVTVGQALVEWLAETAEPAVLDPEPDKVDDWPLLPADALTGVLTWASIDAPYLWISIYVDRESAENDVRDNRLASSGMSPSSDGKWSHRRDLPGTVVVKLNRFSDRDYSSALPALYREYTAG